MATKIIVKLPDEENYVVRIGAGILADIGAGMRAVERLANTQRVLLVTDENVAPLYLAQAKDALARHGFRVSEVTLPAGEQAKSLDVVGEVWRAMAQLGLGRDCVVVALGGGVVGDLSGFVASTYVRGVPVVQIPTTLLAMVDASVGGKTAINLEEGKNLVGTFYQPSFVCADTATLATLPEREWKCGCAEIAKSAVIESDEFFFWLLDHAAELAARDAGIVAEAVSRCVIFKANVVARDVTESAGVRECLNYGHTLGHAIEACTGFGTFSHGACVAEGMLFAAALAKRVLDDPHGDIGAFAAALAELLDALGLGRLDYDVSPAARLDAMKHDKKVRGGQVRFVLARDVATWQVEAVPDDTVLAALEDWRG